MDVHERKLHWEQVYSTKAEDEVSWFQETATTSLKLIDHGGVTPASAIVDIGGGASRLVDGLLDEGYSDVSVLDVSAHALDTAKARLDTRAGDVTWIEADITRWMPQTRYDVWHDRAVLHFLTADTDRAAYLAALKQGLKPGGLAIIGSFALDGPEKCSGLVVQRYSPATLAEFLGTDFALLDDMSETHKTPWGSDQRFQFSRFRFKK
jgi:2-polyprenyl-3-methyl-5-hydroxy-6-metoxy-1,4-benzoquinol methylase